MTAPAPFPASVAASAQCRVVVANQVVADIVHAIGADDVELIVVGAAGGDPHHVEPTPADVTKIARANLVIQIGLGLDRSIGKLHTSSGSTGLLVVVGEGLATTESHGHAHDHGAEQGVEHDDVAHAVDPHIWHDPSKVQVLNERICAALVSARPDRAPEIRGRSALLATKLTALDEWINSQVARIPGTRRTLVTTHDGLAYFGEKYGFRVVAVEIGGDHEGGADPPPSKLLTLVRALQETQSSVIFGDAAHPSRIAATVAREAKVQLVERLYLDTLIPTATKPGTAYLETMRSNVNTIVGALSE